MYAAWSALKYHPDSQVDSVPFFLIDHLFLLTAARLCVCVSCRVKVTLDFLPEWAHERQQIYFLKQVGTTVEHMAIASQGFTTEGDLPRPPLGGNLTWNWRCEC